MYVLRLLDKENKQFITKYDNERLLNSSHSFEDSSSTNFRLQNELKIDDRNKEKNIHSSKKNEIGQIMK